MAYAGAEANPSVGASAILGGTAGEAGITGAEAHANGKVHSSVKTVNGFAGEGDFASTAAVKDMQADNVIQKVKPPKKYTLIKAEVSTCYIAKWNGAYRVVVIVFSIYFVRVIC